MTGEIMPRAVAALALGALREGAHQLRLALCYLEGIGQEERADAVRKALRDLADVEAELQAVQR